jgi:hypothetical protein
MIFGHEALLGRHSSRKLALISGSDEPLSYGRMEMSRSAVSASTPKKRWQATLEAPRTRTNRPPQLSLRLEFTRSTEERSLNRDFSMSGECAGGGTAAGIGIDDGHMAKGAGKLMNLRCVICSIAEIVKAILDESFAFLHQGNGGLAVVKGCCAQDATDGNVKIRGSDVKFVTVPCFLVTLAVALASLVAERGQVGDVFFQRARELQVETFFRSGGRTSSLRGRPRVFLVLLDWMGSVGELFLQPIPWQKWRWHRC